MPRGWFNWTFWQYNETGIINGINAKVDLDLFNGALDDLYKFAGAEPPDQAPRAHVVAAGDSLSRLPTNTASQCASWSARTRSY